MTPAWAQRQEALLRDCLVSPGVFASIVERLYDFMVPYQHALVRRESAQYECRKTRGMRVPYEPFIGKYLSSFPILVGVSKFCIISEFKDWFESESRAPGALITSGMSPLSVYSQISDERFKGPTQPGSIAMAEGAKQLG